jgi:hypothetical protein
MVYYNRNTGPPACDHERHPGNECYKQRLCGDCGFYGHHAGRSRCNMCQICTPKVTHGPDEACPEIARALELLKLDDARLKSNPNEQGKVRGQ